MKKLHILFLTLGMLQVGCYFADMISVSNNTPNNIYVAVYEESKNENPKLFGKVITITPDEIAAVQRPEWGRFKRLNKDNNRNLYFDSGAQGKGRLSHGILSKNFINIGERKGEAFAIYPVMDDGETPSYMGQELKGTTQEDFDKNIKHLIH